MIPLTSHDRTPQTPPPGEEAEVDVNELYELTSEGFFETKEEFAEYAKGASDEDLFEVFDEGTFENVDDLKSYLKKKDDTGEDSGEEESGESTYISEESESLLGSGQSTDEISDTDADNIAKAFEQFDESEKKLGFNFQDNLTPDQQKELNAFMAKEKEDEAARIAQKKATGQTIGSAKPNPVDEILAGPDDSIKLMDKKYGEIGS